MPKAITDELERIRRKSISDTMKRRIKNNEIINAFTKGEKYTKSNAFIKGELSSEDENKLREKISITTKEASAGTETVLTKFLVKPARAEYNVRVAS
jgi:hypothetical protein